MVRAGYQREAGPVSWRAKMLQRRSRVVYTLHNLDAGLPGSDKMVLKLSAFTHGEGQIMSTPWATGMKATSIEEPARLVPTLAGAILGCGGWVLSRGANDAGTVNILFEFERQACMEIYTVLAATGVELSRSGHIWFTELCQCTRDNRQDCGTEIVSVELEIQTFPQGMALGSRAGLVT